MQQELMGCLTAIWRTRMLFSWFGRLTYNAFNAAPIGKTPTVRHSSEVRRICCCRPKVSTMVSQRHDAAVLMISKHLSKSKQWSGKMV
jgi:hypothetical protein